MLKNCVICGKEFKYHTNQKCCSKECKKTYNKQYGKEYQKLPERIEYNKQYGKEYRQNHKEYYKQYGKEYRQNHKEEEHKWRKKYWKTPKGKEVMKKHANRHRNFNFIPLNEWFEKSNAHHIDEINVIYIPKKLHQSISHSVLKNINMNEINILAWNFLETNSY